MKKNTVSYLIIVTLCHIFACSLLAQQQTVISGKITDYDNSYNSCKLINQQLGIKDNRAIINVDSLGQFHYSFDCYATKDLRIIANKAYVTFLIQPGDSVHIEFAANNKHYYNHITFTGDRKTENEQITLFQKVFQDQSTHHNQIVKAADTLNLNDFTIYIDSLHDLNLKIVNSFKKQYNTNKMVSGWIKWWASKPYFYNKYWYPRDHKIVSLPENYYDFQNQLLPINESMLCASLSLELFLNGYWHGTIMPSLQAEDSAILKIWKNNKYLYEREKSLCDSLFLNTITKQAKGNVIKELTIIYWLASELNHGSLQSVENLMPNLENHITIKPLRKGIIDYYIETKSNIEKPKAYSDIINNKQGSTMHAILDSIYNDYSGNVLLFDCWSTSCGPCLARFPEMNLLMTSLKGKKIKFIYLCMDGISNKPRWRNIIGSRNLKGLHYALTKQQSSDLSEAFNIGGIPHYILFDKEGKLINNGHATLNKEYLESLINK